MSSASAPAAPAAVSNAKRQADSHLAQSAAKKKKKAHAPASAAVAVDNDGCPCECAFPHCTLSCDAPKPWCAQHVRILNAGARAMENAFTDYEQEQSLAGDDPVDIFALVAKVSTAVEAEALYVAHCYMTQDPPGQLAMGDCADCDRFQIAMHCESHSHLPVCEACWESAVAAAAAE